MPTLPHCPQEGAPALTLPLLLAVSENDTYVVPAAALAFVERAGSADKTKHVFDASLGLLHEIFNEPTGGAIQMFVDWFIARA